MIQEAEDIHVPEIVEIWEEFMDYHRNIDGFFTRREDAHVNFEGHLRQLMASEDGLVLVAWDGGRVLGYSIAEVKSYPPIFTHERYGFISDIAVRGGHRRKGLGSSMVERMLDWYRARGLNRVELRVALRNEAGNRFWEDMGFEDYIHCMYRQFED